MMDFQGQIQGAVEKLKACLPVPCAAGEGDLDVRLTDVDKVVIVAIFYPFSQFCEINISLLSLQTQPNTAPNLFQRGVEYGKYGR